MTIPEDVLVFPLNTPVQQAVDLKQYLAAKKSLATLERDIATESDYGEGYKELLAKRATECRVIMAKIEEKYKGQ